MKIATFLIPLLLISSCRQPDTDNQCVCKDYTGNVIVDTIYHTEYDMAYQLCSAKEGTQNIENCECYKK